MASVAELLILISGRDSGLSKTLDDADKKAGGLGASLKRIGETASGFVLGQGILKAPEVVGSFISSASDLNETLSKSNTIFGEQGAAIEAWANGAAKGFGQSKQQALEAAGNFGNLFSQLRIGEQDSARMSKGITELASDFASFHNADITQVLDAQSAAFRGEYDSLQRFVPTINAAAVETRALADTGKANAKALTDQEKAIAVYSLMMEGAGAAMGDFDRTSDGLANRQRILSAQFADLQAKIGQALLPVLVELAGVAVNVLIPALETVGGVLVGALGGPVRAVVGAIGSIARAFGSAGKSAGSFGESAGKAAGPIAAFAAFVQGIIPQITGAFGRLKTYFESDIQPALQNLVAAARAVVDFFIANWPLIEAVVRPVIDQTILILQTALGIIGNVFAIVIDLIQGDWAGAWKNFEDIIRLAVNLVQGTIENFGRYIDGVLGLLWAGITAAAGLAWDALVALVSAAVNEVIASAEHMVAEVGRFVGSIPGAILDIVGEAAGAAARLGEGIFNAIVEILSGLPGRMARLGSEAANAFLDSISVAGVSAGDVVDLVGGGLSKIGIRGSGGPASGWTIVGDRGPELVRFGASGPHVFSSQDSAHMLGGGGGATLIVNLNVNGAILEAERDIVRVVRDEIVRGGFYGLIQQPTGA